MANTLRVVLILIGTALTGLGIFLLLFPNAQMPFHLESEGRTSQTLAMIAFGILALLVGLAYKRK